MNRHTARGAALGFVAALGACAAAVADPADADASAAAFVTGIPDVLASHGPLGWIELADPHDFRMFSDGAEKFADAAALRDAMAAFAPTVRSMELRWHDLAVEGNGADAARFVAMYDETLVHIDGTNAQFAGCATGLLRRGVDGWRITRLHWSQPR